MNHTKGKVEVLESMEYFDLMQQYRIAPQEDQQRVIKAFEDVKKYLVDNLTNETGYTPAQLEDRLQRAERLLSIVNEDLNLETINQFLNEKP